jgi:hypothetical protein
MDNIRYRRLKMTKNWCSFIRILIQIILDIWKFQQDSAFSDLLLNTFENISNGLIALAGMRLLKVNNGITGICGITASSIGCWKLHKRIQGTSLSIINTQVN